jgi:hypothetical protein
VFAVLGSILLGLVAYCGALLAFPHAIGKEISKFHRIRSQTHNSV